MSIYCGASFGGGQGYTDTCGQEEYGKGTPLAQCKQCMRQEIHQLKAENESLRADADRYEHLKKEWQDDFLIGYLDSNVHPCGWDEVIDARMNRSPESPSQ